MPVSPQLQRKIREMLGTDAADDLVTMLQDMDTYRADLRELRHEMQVGFARLETGIEKSAASLIKWSFVFWVGAVGAIAALAGVLR